MKEKKQLLAIKNNFLKEVDSFIIDFKEFLSLLKQENFLKKDLLILHRDINCIVATAGTFDFKEVSEISFAMEYYIDDFINSTDKSEEAFITSMSVMLKELIFALEKVKTAGKGSLENKNKAERYKKNSNSEKKILIAENDEYVANSLKNILKKGDYKVLITKNGSEAIRVFNNNYKSLGVAILDEDMPEKNGFHILNHIKDVKADLAVILLLSSERSLINKSEIFKQSVYDYIVKPFNIKELALKIENILL